MYIRGESWVRMMVNRFRWKLVHGASVQEVQEMYEFINLVSTWGLPYLWEKTEFMFLADEYREHLSNEVSILRRNKKNERESVNQPEKQD
jgi:hypothetical protein